MFYDGDKIAILLYVTGKKVKRSGESIAIYQRFRSKSHITHEVFLFAQAFKYLDVYEFKAGKFMPESEIVNEGINKYFIYNPVFDEYDYNGELEMLDQAEEFLHKIPDYERNELIKIRAKCEEYTPSQLYILLYKSEEAYILNKTIDDKMHKQITATIEDMYWNGMYMNYPIKEATYNKLKESFHIHYA
jgi:hypothetical protein